MTKPTQKALALAYSAVLLFILTLTGPEPFYTALLALFITSILAYSKGLADRQAKILYRIEVSRSVEPEYTYEGSVVVVGLSITNNSGFPVGNLLIEDEKPLRLGGGRERILVDHIEPHGVYTVSYSVKPPPGLHEFRHVMLEAGDPLGLFVERRRIEVYKALRVAPASLRGFTGSPQQLHGTAEVYVRAVRGAGYELFEVREYMPGDDPRRISWSATARHRRLMVREDLSETITKVYILVDLSEDVWTGLPGVSAGDYIMRAAETIAQETARMSGTLGYTIYNGETWISKAPSRGFDVLHDLTVKLSIYSPTDAVKRFNLYDAVQASSRLATPGLLVILTGPGFMREYNVGQVVKALSGHRGDKAILVFLPGGGDMASRAVRMIELHHYSRVKGDFERSGVRVYIGSSAKPLAGLRWHMR
ncbi:MAG: DUF58 domain-containing protein [Desulfurococcales archaeon]|nr:DUF58 domain-containing protein [Desulfurococcales archaeon]